MCVQLPSFFFLVRRGGGWGCDAARAAQRHHRACTPPHTAPRRSPAPAVLDTSSYGSMSSSSYESDGEGRPRDHRKLAYSIMVLLGAGLLIPWNAIVCAVDYFRFIHPEVRRFRRGAAGAPPQR